MQHEAVGATLVDPDRRAIRAEQAIGADAAGFEANGEVERGRDLRGELLDELAQIALELVLLTKPTELESDRKRIGQVCDVGIRVSGRDRLDEPDGEQAGALASADERKQKC